MADQKKLTKHTATYQGVTHTRLSARAYTHCVIRCLDGVPSKEKRHAAWCTSERLAVAFTRSEKARFIQLQGGAWVPCTTVIVPVTPAT